MADMHPNDIGLATFEDVGDVAKLKTVAKTVVGAVNELYQSNDINKKSLGKQLYVDGENNIIIGENNVVYGSGNLIIGSNNIVVGDDINLVAEGASKYTSDSSNVTYISFNARESKLNYALTISPTGSPPAPFHIGNKIILSITKVWMTPAYDDWVKVESGVQLAEIINVNESSKYIELSGFNLSADPPDEAHTVEQTTVIGTCIPLNEEHKVQGSPDCVSFGGTVSGKNSVAFSIATALGTNALAACNGTARGDYSAAFCLGNTHGYCSFANNTGRSYGDYSTALNNGTAYSPYSLSHGHYCRVAGRPLKCISINQSDKSLEIDYNDSLVGISAGSKILLRCFSSSSSLILSEIEVKSVNEHTIYLNPNVFLGGSGTSAYQLFPDGIIFAIDNSTSYANASTSGGYYTIASGKYTTSNGQHTVAGAEGANIWGKYGLITDPYSLALANGNNTKTLGLAFKVLSTGSVHADSAYTTPCADYAEYFEWLDGNPDSEDRVGYFVKLSGDKIVKCGEFDTPLGIVSATPAIVGDSAELHWKDKFVTDDFGRVQYHDVVVPAEYDENENLICEEHIERQPIINPDWDNLKEYISRNDRAEWAPVGVLGKLIVYDDGTLKTGDICRPGPDGIAVKSIENGYPVLKRISDDKVLIWFRG